MNDEQYKKKFKFPSCTMSPWSFLIPFKDRPEVMRAIKQECLDAYGEDYTECPKRLVCISDQCIGRPLPYKSKTALPYLEELAKTQKIVNNELFIEGCSTCPIAKTCVKTCPTVNDFVNRNKVEDVKLIYKGNHQEVQSEAVEESGPAFIPSNMPIPWDALTTEKAQVVRGYIYQQRDFKYLADKFDLNNQARAKYEFYAALTRLSEFAVMRKFIADHADLLTDTQNRVLSSVYIDNMPLKEVANFMGVSKQAISNMVTKVITTHKIRWEKFVTKKNRKVIYNVPELMK